MLLCTNWLKIVTEGTMFIIDVGDGLFEMADFLLHEGLQIRFISADGQTSDFLVLVTLLEGYHHAEVLSKNRIVRYLR